MSLSEQQRDSDSRVAEQKGVDKLRPEILSDERYIFDS